MELVCECDDVTVAKREPKARNTHFSLKDAVARPSLTVRKERMREARMPGYISREYQSYAFDKATLSVINGEVLIRHDGYSAFVDIEALREIVDAAAAIARVQQRARKKRTS
jgi:hypothetical protein